MKITIIAVGRLKQSQFKKLAREYHERLEHYRPLDVVDVRESSANAAEKRRSEEGEAIVDAVPHGAVFIALDEQGKEWTSEELADWLNEKMVRGTRHVAFAVGGPEGLSDLVTERADVTLALSRMTFPHDMARVVLAEQLYRAFTIIRGEPYHR